MIIRSIDIGRWNGKRTASMSEAVLFAVLVRHGKSVVVKNISFAEGISYILKLNQEASR